MNPATIENLNHEWPPQDPSKFRRMRVMLPQFYATLAIFAINLSYAIFEPAMYLDLAHIDLSFQSGVAYTMLAGIALLLGGILAQIVGARGPLIFAGAASVVGWISSGWISSISVLQWTFYVAVLARGMMQAPAYVYLAEISQPNTRNALMAVLCLSENIGPIFMYVADGISVKIAAVFNVVIVLFGLVTMFILPDSPYWLASRGRYNRVELSLAWFRGRTSTETVKTESKAIIGNVNNSPTAFKLFARTSLYIQAIIVCYIFLVSLFVRVFLLTHFHHVGSLLMNRDYGYSIILGWIIATVYTMIAFVVLIVAVGKRIMILISLSCGMMAFLAATIFGFLSEKGTLSMDAWLLLSCLAVVYFACITGIVSVPLILNGELFPTKLRYFGAGFALCFAYLVQVGLTNLYLSYLYSSPGVGLGLAFASMFGILPLLWVFPRTDDKSLVEIEHSSASISELTRKK